MGTRAAAPLISQIKVVAPRMALEVIDQAVQMHGAAGVSQDFPLARMWTSVRTLRLADGPDAVHRRVISKAEMKRYSNEGRREARRVPGGHAARSTPGPPPMSRAWRPGDGDQKFRPGSRTRPIGSRLPGGPLRAARKPRANC